MRFPVPAAIIAVLVFACGCVKRPSANVIADINSKSEMAGLRPISPNWRLAQNSHDTNGYFLAWVYGSGHRWAGSDARTVQLDTQSSMQCTEDFYYSGRRFSNFDVQNMDESLTIHFDCNKGLCAVRLITDNKSLERMVPETIQNEGGNPRDALKIADEILALWKVKRQE